MKKQILISVVLFVAVIMCGCQTSKQVSVSPTISSSATLASAVTPNLITINTLPTILTSTSTPHPSATDASTILPSGQYIVSAEGNNCELGSADSVCDLRIISMDGSTNTILAKNLSGFGFLYDNKRIAFTNTLFLSNQQDYQIRLLDLNSNKIFDVPYPGEKNCSAEGWSLDGNNLIVLCHSLNDYRNFDIAILSIQDGTMTTFLHDSNNEDNSGGYEQARLSPDGKWLAFYRLTSRGPELVDGLYVLDMSCLSELVTCQAKTQKLLIKKIEGSRGNRIVSWTSEGYLAIAVDNDIQIYDISQQKIIRIITVGSTADDIQNMSWSPDGKWIIVNMRNSGNSLLISTKNGETTNSAVAIENPFWLTLP